MLSSPPTAPGALPLLGHALPLLRAPLRFLNSLPSHGDVVAVRIGPFKAMVVCDPELVHRMLVDDRTFDKGGVIFNRAREVFGNGVGTCPHRDHRRQRRLVQPAFHRHRLAGYAELMADQVASVIDSWRAGQVIDVVTEMQTITTRVLVATMFANALPPDRLRHTRDDVAVVLGGIYRRIVMPPPLDKLPIAGNRRYDRARAHLRRTIGGIIAEYRASAVDHGDLLSILLSTSDGHVDAGGGQRLTDDEVCDQVITFFLAGTETTAATLAWALHLLSQHPDIDARVHRETGAAPAATYQGLPALGLTGRVIMETLRLYPPVWFLTRVATKDTQLGDYPLRAGTTIVYSPYLLHHRPDRYRDPERFDPDRWGSQATASLPRGVFVPFGAGARKCIGEDFGITEAVLALAAITARWRLEPLPGQLVRAAPSLELKPRALLMRARSRTPLNQAHTEPVPGSPESPPTSR
jgi:cytochrome P450